MLENRNFQPLTSKACFSLTVREIRTNPKANDNCISTLLRPIFFQILTRRFQGEKIFLGSRRNSTDTVMLFNFCFSFPKSWRRVCLDRKELSEERMKIVGKIVSCNELSYELTRIFVLSDYAGSVSAVWP